MLIDMEEPAIKAGIPANVYWNLTFKELMLELVALESRRKRELKEKAMFDYNLANAMGIAFNNPQKMPPAEKLYPMLADDEQQVAEQEEKPKDIVPVTSEQDKAMFMQMAAVVKNHNKNKE